MSFLDMRKKKQLMENYWKSMWIDIHVCTVKPDDY